MALDAVRTTLSIATMIGAAVKERAGELAGGVLEIPGVGPSAIKALELGGQASVLAEEVTALLATNRSAITDVLRAEIGLQLQRVGLSTPDAPDADHAEIDRLKAEVADLRKALEAASVAAGRSSDNRRASAATKRAAASKSTASKSTASPASKSAVRKTTSKATPAKATPAKATAAKKTAPTSTAAKKTAAGRAAAKKQPAPVTSPVSPSPVTPTPVAAAHRAGTDTSYSDLELDA